MCHASRFLIFVDGCRNLLYRLLLKKFCVEGKSMETCQICLELSEGLVPVTNVDVTRC